MWQLKRAFPHGRFRSRMYICECPGLLEGVRGTHIFHNLKNIETTLRAAPADSESVLSVPVLALQGCVAQRPAAQKYVEPPRKQAELEPSSFSGGENIRESQ